LSEARVSMKRSGKRTEPASYEFRIKERLSSQLAVWFEEMSLEVVDATNQPHTILRGPIQDQAALYGLIGRIRDLGLTLVSVCPKRQEEDS